MSGPPSPPSPLSPISLGSPAGERHTKGKYLGRIITFTVAGVLTLFGGVAVAIPNKDGGLSAANITGIALLILAAFCWAGGCLACCIGFTRNSLSDPVKPSELKAALAGAHQRV